MRILVRYSVTTSYEQEVEVGDGLDAGAVSSLAYDVAYESDSVNDEFETTRSVDFDGWQPA